MTRERQPCVYILASRRNGTFYTGVTSDLIARVHQHREGITGGFAAKYRTYILVYYEMHGEMEPAIRREKALETRVQAQPDRARQSGLAGFGSGAGLLAAAETLAGMRGGPRHFGRGDGGS